LNLDQNLNVDASKIRRELNYRETTSRQDALARCIAWERCHQPSEKEPALFDYGAEDAILNRLSSSAAIGFNK